MTDRYVAELHRAGHAVGHLVWRGAFSSGTHYYPGDLVTSAGSTYLALVERAPGGASPPSAGVWSILSDVFAGNPQQSPPNLPKVGQGVPQLRGPYVVDYTDIPHDGDRMTLWTPQQGDALLRLFPDWQTATQWDHGKLFIGQNVDGTLDPPHNTIVRAGAGTTLDPDVRALDMTWVSQANDGSGVAVPGTAYVFRTTDPVQIQLAQVGENPDPTQGHVELYALVARAVPVS